MGTELHVCLPLQILEKIVVSGSEVVFSTVASLEEQTTVPSV